MSVGIDFHDRRGCLAGKPLENRREYLAGTTSVRIEVDCQGFVRLEQLPELRSTPDRDRLVGAILSLLLAFETLARSRSLLGPDPFERITIVGFAVVRVGRVRAYCAGEKPLLERSSREFRPEPSVKLPERSSRAGSITRN